MYFNKFIKQYVEDHKNLNETNLSTSRVADAQTDGTTIYNSSNMETIIALVVDWVFFFIFILLKRWEITLRKKF